MGRCGSPVGFLRWQMWRRWKNYLVQKNVSSRREGTQKWSEDDAEVFEQYIRCTATRWFLFLSRNFYLFYIEMMIKIAKIKGVFCNFCLTQITDWNCLLWSFQVRISRYMTVYIYTGWFSFVNRYLMSDTQHYFKHIQSISIVLGYFVFKLQDIKCYQNILFQIKERLNQALILSFDSKTLQQLHNFSMRHCRKKFEYYMQKKFHWYIR